MRSGLGWIGGEIAGFVVAGAMGESDLMEMYPVALLGAVAGGLAA